MSPRATQGNELLLAGEGNLTDAQASAASNCCPQPAAIAGWVAAWRQPCRCRRRCHLASQPAQARSAKAARARSSSSFKYSACRGWVGGRGGGEHSA